MGMHLQLSPGVSTKEFDLTLVIQQAATAGGAYVGSFAWGPVNKVKLISNEEELVNIFGRPDDDTFKHFFTAKNFLDYSANLKVVRVVEDTAMNATADGTGILIKNETDWLDQYAGGAGAVEEWAARCPGSLGNSIRVEMADAGSFNAVASTSITSAGVGYKVADNGAAVTFGAPPSGGTTATGTIVVTNNVLTGITITNPGKGYRTAPGVSLPMPLGVGTIISTTITSAGSGYTTAADHGQAVTFAAGGGVTATGTLIVIANVVTGITVTNAGSGYVAAPVVTLPLPIGGGTRATATASITVTRGTATAELWNYKNQFLSAPGTSSRCAAKGGSNDEMHIIVIDNDGGISGEAGTILEKYPFVSKASDIFNDDGTSAYYVNVIRDQSKYIFWMDHKEADWGVPAVDTVFSSMTEPFSVTLSGGVDGNDVSNNELYEGWDFFKDKDTINIGIVLSGPADQVLKEYLIQNIAEHRKDCVACISPDMEHVVNNKTNEVTDILTLRSVLSSSSYGIFDCNWKYQFDRYNDTFRWVPCNGDVGGLIAYTEENRDAWWSPAGFSRGHLKNVVKLAWNPDKTDRDELYVNGVNPIVVIAGEGTILYGDKTMLSKPSAFDRINVRRLFIVLEKSIADAAKYALFEFNDSFTRLRFRQIVEPFLRDVQGRRGITSWKVVCDETNNTPYVIDTNNFVGDIYIAPARSINFVSLNFVASPTGINFEEIQGQFGDF